MSLPVPDRLIVWWNRMIAGELTNDPEKPVQPRDADHSFATLVREEKVLEIKDLQLGPFPLARSARHDFAGLVRIGADTPAEAGLM